MTGFCVIKTNAYKNKHSVSIDTSDMLETPQFI